MRIGRFLEVGPVRGDPLQIGARRLTPMAWTTIVRITMPRVPLAGAFVWTRPLAVEVEDPTGVRHIPILGPRAWIGLALVAGAVPALLLRFLSGERRREG